MLRGFLNSRRVSDCDYAIFQNELHHGPDLLSAMSKESVSIVFNPAPCSPSTMEIFDFSLVHALIINQVEGNALCNILTGKKTESGAWTALYEDDLKQIFKPFSRLVVCILTLGKRGACILVRHSTGIQVHYVGAPPIYVVDTTGAGDTLVGYWVAQLIKSGISLCKYGISNPISETEIQKIIHGLEIAVTAATMACAVAGAIPSIPDSSDVTARCQFLESTHPSEW
jgi:ribokinase